MISRKQRKLKKNLEREIRRIRRIQKKKEQDLPPPPKLVRQNAIEKPSENKEEKGWLAWLFGY